MFVVVEFKAPVKSFYLVVKQVEMKVKAFNLA